MRLTQYIRRLIVMLTVAMPAAALVLAIGSLLRGPSSEVGDALGGAIMLVYIWSEVTGEADTEDDIEWRSPPP